MSKRTPGSKPRPGLRRLAFVLAAPLIGLALVELGLRLANVTPAQQAKRSGAVVRSSSIPGLDFEPSPGATEVLDYGEDRPVTQRQIKHQFNAQSLRGDLVPTPRRADHGPRIICLGDSQTFGTGVHVHETWPARLAAILAARGFTGHEVVNAGVPGYDTAQEAIWLEQTALPLQPDLILLQYFLNDTAIRGLVRKHEPEPSRLVHLVHPRQSGWVADLRRWSRTVDVALDAVYRMHSLGEHTQRLTRWHDSADPGWLRVQEALVRARDHSARSGVAFAVILYPMLLRDGPVFVSHSALARVSSACADLGIPVFDAELALLASPIPDDRLRVAPGDFHAGAEAHEVVAQAVADWLQGPESPFNLDPWLADHR